MITKMPYKNHGYLAKKVIEHYLDYKSYPYWLYDYIYDVSCYNILENIEKINEYTTKDVLNYLTKEDKLIKLLFSRIKRKHDHDFEMDTKLREIILDMVKASERAICIEFILKGKFENVKALAIRIIKSCECIRTNLPIL